MPAAKARGTPDAMKSEEGNDSLDTLIRQAIGKEPFLSFSRAGDSPVQWIQLLHALDQQDLPGWPLLTPLKVQMQNCEKCSREFCSPINYRRHIRVHRRSLNVDKESHKNRDLLGAFWNKLSLDEIKEILSFKDVSLEEVTGSSIIRSLTSLVCKAGFSTLPQVYVKAGSALLDIIQDKPYRLPISSQELFSILDDASERTFLCAGTAESMQKYVFDGEAEKIGLDMKNIVACTSFLVEQKLVKAWLADKDAEALRCQKLLVEEEEAAQKRQAELLERKRQKKLRQKEQRAKDQSKAYLDVTANILERTVSTEMASPLIHLESDSHGQGISLDSVPLYLGPIQFSTDEEDDDIEGQVRFSGKYSDLATGQNAEPQMMHRIGHQHSVITRHQVPKSQWGRRNGVHANQNLQSVKLEPMQKHGPARNKRTASSNGSKVWTRKSKVENKEENVRSTLLQEATDQADGKCEVIIGSIKVTMRNCFVQQQCNSLMESRENCTLEHARTRKSCVQERPTNPDSVQSVANRSTVKLWRAVSRHETRGELQVHSDNDELGKKCIPGKGDEGTVPGDCCVQSCESDGNDGVNEGNLHPSAGEIGQQPDGLLFKSSVAEAFLAQRWIEAISADHVTLSLSPEPPGNLGTHNNCHVASSTSNFNECNNFDRGKYRLANVGAIEPSNAEIAKANLRTKAERSFKTKYFSKKKTITWGKIF